MSEGEGEASTQPALTDEHGNIYVSEVQGADPTFVRSEGVRYYLYNFGEGALPPRYALLPLHSQVYPHLDVFRRDQCLHLLFQAYKPKSEDRTFS